MILDQMGVVTVQSRRMCSGVSGVVWHKGHEESMKIFRLWSRDLVGRLLWQKSHIKVLILRRVGVFQIHFHLLLGASEVRSQAR